MAFPTVIIDPDATNASDENSGTSDTVLASGSYAGAPASSIHIGLFGASDKLSSDTVDISDISTDGDQCIQLNDTTNGHNALLQIVGKDETTLVGNGSSVYVTFTGTLYTWQLTGATTSNLNVSDVIYIDGIGLMTVGSIIDTTTFTASTSDAEGTPPPRAFCKPQQIIISSAGSSDCYSALRTWKIGGRKLTLTVGKLSRNLFDLGSGTAGDAAAGWKIYVYVPAAGFEESVSGFNVYPVGNETNGTIILKSFANSNGDRARIISLEHFFYTGTRKGFTGWIIKGFDFIPGAANIYWGYLYASTKCLFYECRWLKTDSYIFKNVLYNPSYSSLINCYVEVADYLGNGAAGGFRIIDGCYIYIENVGNNYNCVPGASIFNTVIYSPGSNVAYMVVSGDGSGINNVSILGNIYIKYGSTYYELRIKNVILCANTSQETSALVPSTTNLPENYGYYTAGSHSKYVYFRGIVYYNWASVMDSADLDQFVEYEYLDYINADPQYADPENGDFTPTNPAIKSAAFTSNILLTTNETGNWPGAINPSSTGSGTNIYYIEE